MICLVQHIKLELIKASLKKENENLQQDLRQLNESRNGLISIQVLQDMMKTSTESCPELNQIFIGMKSGARVILLN